MDLDKGVDPGGMLLEGEQFINPVENTRWAGSEEGSISWSVFFRNFSKFKLKEAKQ